MNPSGVVDYLAQPVRPGDHFTKKMSTVDFCGSVETLKVGTHAELQQERCFSTNLLASLSRLLSKRGFGPFSCTNLIDIVN